MVALPKRPRETVPVMVDGPLSAVVMPFQIRPPEDALVVIVKCLLSIAHGEVAEPMPEPPLPTGDAPFDDDPNASLRYANDYVPFKPRADVLLIGNAYPKGGRAKLASVRFGFGKHLRRSLSAVGDRVWKGDVPSEPAPFSSMPLRYERAFGGAGHPQNPVGVGYGEGPRGSLLPNLEQQEKMIRARRDSPEPACFGPRSLPWRLSGPGSGTYDAAWRKSRWPYFPADFDWTTLNAAPSAQQIDYPRGDESFSIAGVHPTLTVIEGSLPGLRPRAFSVPGEGALREVPLVLDTVWFDADALQVALVFRGHMAVSAASAPEIEAVFVTSEQASAPLPAEAIQARLEAKAVALYGALGENTSALPASDSEPESISSSAEASRVFAEEPKPRGPAASRASIEARLASLESLAGVDWSGGDLTGLDLRERDLSNALLVGASLDGARFDEANLTGAVLSRSVGRGASFKGATLTSANLSACAFMQTDFSGANLSGASLSGADLFEVRFEEATADHLSLDDAKLASVDFRRANLTSAALSAAELTGVSFEGATLTDAQMYDVAGEGTRFASCSMLRLRADGAKLARSVFDDADASEANFEGADLERTSFQRATLTAAVFTAALLTSAKLTAATCRRARFRHARLEGVSALGADFMEANFEGAMLTRADLRGANLHAAETLGADLRGAKLGGALVTASKLEEEAS